MSSYLWFDGNEAFLDGIQFYRSLQLICYFISKLILGPAPAYDDLTKTVLWYLKQH
jgi:hypothetical protein